MHFLLVPDGIAARYDCLTAETLKKRGITLLLSDLDFTLAPKSVQLPDKALRDWIESLQQAGITVMIISNNRSEERVLRFCQALGIPFQGHAGKPSPKGLNAAMARCGVGRNQTAMLGDKLLTDVLAAHRAGVSAWMVEPLGGAQTLWQKVLHMLQAPFKALCRERIETK